MLMKMIEKMSSGEFIAFCLLVPLMLLFIFLFFQVIIAGPIMESFMKRRIYLMYVKKRITKSDSDYLLSKIINKEKDKSLHSYIRENNYSYVEKEEKENCNIFRVLLIATVVTFVIMLLSAKIFSVSNLSIPSLINRILIVLPFMFLIVYFSREASRHRKSMIINRQKYLDLNILNDYINNLPKDKQIEVRMKLLEHFFNHKEFDYKCEPLISKEFIKALNILQKTCDLENKSLNKMKKTLKKN